MVEAQSIDRTAFFEDLRLDQFVGDVEQCQVVESDEQPPEVERNFLTYHGSDLDGRACVGNCQVGHSGRTRRCGNPRLGCWLVQFCDGVTEGFDGMEMSLWSRDVIALSTAVSLSHATFDAALLLGICDKIVPGLLIGALRFPWLPAIFVPGGPTGAGSRYGPNNGDCSGGARGPGATYSCGRPSRTL